MRSAELILDYICSIMSKNTLQPIIDYFRDKSIAKAWLFGSYARNEQKRKSDIDILVQFTDTKNIGLIYYSRMVNELENITGKKVDLVEFGQIKDFAVNSVTNDMKLFYEQ